MKLLHSGKVRDVYQDDNGELLLVASDRVSVYDVTLPTEVPQKGVLLTQLSAWWFGQLADVVPNHVISMTDVPEQWAGRAMRCRPLTMLPIECIARGYLAGLGLREYQKYGSISGVELPEGLAEGSRLPETIFTPTTKATSGHDEFMTFEDAAKLIGQEPADRIRELTIEIYDHGAERAFERGIIIADTKLEFGYDADGVLRLADEVLTSDSSRFWPAAEWEPGRPQHAFDKQYVRDWSLATGWDKTAPGPAMPAEVVEATRARYIEVYEQITGQKWSN